MQSWDIINFNKMQMHTCQINSIRERVYVSRLLFSFPARILVISSSTVLRQGFESSIEVSFRRRVACHRESRVNTYLYAKFHKLQSHIQWSELFTISERRIPGKIHVFRNISTTKCVYTGVHFASLELPPAIRLSYRLLPVVKPYRSKRSSVGHFAGITIDKKAAFILGVCCASSIIFERRHNQYYISRLSNLKFLQKNYLYFLPILKLSLL